MATRPIKVVDMQIEIIIIQIGGSALTSNKTQYYVFLGNPKVEALNTVMTYTILVYD